MVWLSVRDVMGLPPKQSRLMYSETDIPAASACLVSLSFSSALIRRVRRHAKRGLLPSFSFMMSSFFWSVRSEAPNTRSPEAKPLAGCYVCCQTGVILQGKTLFRRFVDLGLAMPCGGLQLFRFWEEIYRKNDFIRQQKRKLLRIGFMWTNFRVAKCRQSKKLSVAQKSFSSNLLHK